MGNFSQFLAAYVYVNVFCGKNVLQNLSILLPRASYAVFHLYTYSSVYTMAWGESLPDSCVSNNALLHLTYLSRVCRLFRSIYSNVLSNASSFLFRFILIGRLYCRLVSLANQNQRVHSYLRLRKQLDYLFTVVSAECNSFGVAVFVATLRELSSSNSTLFYINPTNERSAVNFTHCVTKLCVSAQWFTLQLNWLIRNAIYYSLLLNSASHFHNRLETNSLFWDSEFSFAFIVLATLSVPPKCKLLLTLLVQVSLVVVFDPDGLVQKCSSCYSDRSNWQFRVL